MSHTQKAQNAGFEATFDKMPFSVRGKKVGQAILSCLYPSSLHPLSVYHLIFPSIHLWPLSACIGQWILGQRLASPLAKGSNMPCTQMYGCQSYALSCKATNCQIYNVKVANPTMKTYRCVATLFHFHMYVQWRVSPLSFHLLGLHQLRKLGAHCLSR